MRRISLALALLGAVAAAGCGGAGGKSPAPSSGNKGIEQAQMKLVVRGEGAFFDPVAGTTIILPKGGVITSSPAGINCGANGATLNKACEFSFAFGTVVTLTATPNTAGWVFGWAGACTGTGACSFTMDDTQFVGVRFAASSGSLGAHGPFTAPEIHAAEYLKLQQGQAGAYDCAACHGGAALTGAGLAPSCSSCHNWPLGGHFNPAGAMAGHSSGSCARCHNGLAFRDLIGADGTAVNVTSIGYLSTDPTPLDTTTAFATPGQMQCATCHNGATVLGGGSLNQHKFASGVVYTFTVETKSAICSQCHDGGRPGYNIAQVNAVLSWNSSVGPDAQLVATNAQVRAHYLSAASTLLGGAVGSWSQVTGNIYTGANEHGGVAGCTFCHNAHTGELPPDSNVNVPEDTIRNKCGPCHYNDAGAAVASFLELEESRQFGFEGDVDNNPLTVTVKDDLDGLAAKLYVAIQTYSNSIAGQQVCFFNNRWYNDTGAGTCGTAPNAGTPAKFTPRLLKATFNYGMYTTDPGAWAHNPRYVAEAMYDSIADLNLGLGAAFVPNGKRAFNGHFGAAEDASPYAAMIYHGGSNALTGEVLPTMGFTSAACYQCHGGQVGLDTYLTGMPAAIASIPAGGKVNAMQCDTCHKYDGKTMQGLRVAPTVYFPPQKNNAANAAQVSFTPAQLPPSFPLCGSCHSGRENGQSITNKGGTDGTFALTFVNPHYLGAAGMMLGDSAKVMFQYPTKSYQDKPVFWSLTVNGPHGSPHAAMCTGCHNPKGSKHTFEIDLAATIPDGNYCPGGNMAACAPNTKACNGCHAGPYALAPKITEYEDAAAELLAAIKAYVATNLTAIQTASVGVAFTGPPAFTFDASSVLNITGVCYSGANNPYFFYEVSGACTNVAGTTYPAMSFGKFDPKLLKAAYNYQWTQKEPGAWAHNEFYVMQVIYDSIVDLGGTPSFKVAAKTDPTTHLPVAGDPLNRGY
jgi:hypothetical protein